MPKFAVMVERMVPQWTTVVVEAERAEDINAKTRQEIFDAACLTDGWVYDDDGERANVPSAVEVVDADEWKVDPETDPVVVKV